MPAYNCNLFVKEAVESILHQTFQDFELLITDDASTDNTYNVLEPFKKDSRVKVFRNKTNKGYLKTCNDLFSKCSGKYITFQDADDVSVPERIKVLVNEFEKEDDLFMVGSGFYRIVNNKNEVVLNKYYSHTELLQLLPDRLPFAWAAFMFKKELLTSCGYYNEYFDRIGEEDYYWGGKIISKFKTKCLSEPLYGYRSNPNSVSKDRSDIRKVYSGKIAKYLLQQQLKFGKDSLTGYSKRPLHLKENTYRIEALLWRNKWTFASLYVVKSILFYPETAFSNIKLLFRYFPNYIKSSLR